MSLIRNKIEAVRCPALGGACVEVSACKGRPDPDGGQGLLPCPYFLADKGAEIRCTFHPTQPKKAIRQHNDKSRPSAMIQGAYRMTSERIFALQVHAGKEHGPEWESARVNIAGQP